MENEAMKEMFKPKINENIKVERREPLYQSQNKQTESVMNTIVVSAT